MKKQISIRWILILGMPGLVMGIITLIILSSFFSSREVFTEHAREIMQNISSYTIDKAKHHLNPARDAALLTSGLADNHIVTSSRKSEMESYFYEQLLVNSQFSNIYYGTVEGEFVMVSRLESNDFRTKVISFPNGKREVLFRESDHYFNEKRSYLDQSDNYDPRKRPWFIEAIEKRNLIWTDPYVFFESRNPGITTASPVYNENGSLHGVVGVDIEISELSDFLGTLSIGKNGKAFILDRNGQVLAYPDKDRITHNEGESDSVSLVSIAELDDNVSKAAFNELKSLDYEINNQEELFFTFLFDGEVYHAMFAPFRASYWPWLLGIYIPEDDYLGSLKSNRTFTVLLSLILGLITVVIGFAIARSINQPLRSLQVAAIKVGAGNLGDPLRIKTFYRELVETIGAFEHMRFELSEKNNIEEQLEQTRKVDSLGRLAGGVAHDLNNLLTPVLGYSEILEKRIENETHKKQIHQIYKAGLKARDLVQQLLAFSRKQNLEYRPIDLNLIIKSFESLLKRTIREDISIELNESSINPVIMADPGQIEQVILNLSVNAQDAMPEGGKLSISTDVLSETELPYNCGVVSETGKIVVLTIRDTGKGMNEDLKKQIFEPFFSTKGEFGIGLGLATVFGIVKQHKGQIYVESEEDLGSCFSIYLPYSKASAGTPRENLLGDQSLGGSETILVVEDNPQVMELTVTILTGLGYRVYGAQDGLEALNFFSGKKYHIDLLLTDIIMPGMNGKELFDKAVKLQRDLKVVYMSGYASNTISQFNVAESGSPFLQKPFSAGSLSGKVREVLKKD